MPRPGRTAGGRWLRTVAGRRGRCAVGACAFAFAGCGGIGDADAVTVTLSGISLCSACLNMGGSNWFRWNSWVTNPNNTWVLDRVGAPGDCTWSYFSPSLCSGMEPAIQIALAITQTGPATWDVVFEAKFCASASSWIGAACTGPPASTADTLGVAFYRAISDVDLCDGLSNALGAGNCSGGWGGNNGIGGQAAFVPGP